MVPGNSKLKLLFIINSRSGNNNLDFAAAIESYCGTLVHEAVIVPFPDVFEPAAIKALIRETAPDRVIAVGGDGTVKAIAECLLHGSIPLGIIPAGSANGMARELGIPTGMEQALDLAISGTVKQIHVVMVNDLMCIHLCDIGFNAFVVREFERQEQRGMWSYVKAAWRVLWRQPRMQVTIKTDDKIVRREAAMVVVANATQYGTGVIINPEGSLEDDLFEIVIVRQVSFSEIFKMKVSHRPFDPQKTEVYATTSLDIRSRRKVHFQVDGEYIGKVNKINATIAPAALRVMTAAGKSLS